MNKSRGKVLLLSPGDSKRGENLKNVLRYPYGLLVLAAQLEENYYSVTIVDARVCDYRSVDYSKYIFVGLSLCSYGAALRDGLVICEWIKRMFADCPIVIGGPFVSSGLRYFQGNPLFDYAVVGEGDHAIVELANVLSGRGAGFSSANVVDLSSSQSIPAASVVGDLNQVAAPAYHLISAERYGTCDEIDYQLSRGCVNRCSFCYNTAVERIGWRAKRAQKAISELVRIYGVLRFRKVNFLDDHLFIDVELLLEVLRGLGSCGVEFSWNGCCTVDRIVELPDAKIDELVDRGCSMLHFGVESGSGKILRSLNKSWTYNGALPAAEKCIRKGITPVFSLMIGLPGETRADRNETLALYDRLLECGAGVSKIYPYVPIEGTPLARKAKALGYEMPESLQGWTLFDDSSSRYNLSVPAKEDREIKNISIMSRLKFYFEEYFVRREESYKRMGLAIPDPLAYLAHRAISWLPRIVVGLLWRSRLYRSSVLLWGVQYITNWLHARFSASFPKRVVSRSGEGGDQNAAKSVDC